MLAGCLSLQVVARCDITLLQEVMDTDGKAIKALLASLNRYKYSKSRVHDSFCKLSAGST